MTLSGRVHYLSIPEEPDTLEAHKGAPARGDALGIRAKVEPGSERPSSLTDPCPPNTVLTKENPSS